MKAHLTDLTIQRLKPGIYFDDATPSFGIRVGKNRKTFMIRKGPKRRHVTIGHYPVMTLSDARKKAKLMLLEEEQAECQPLTYREAVEHYFQTYSAQNHRPSTRREIKRHIEGRFGPKLNEKQLADITTRNIMDVIDTLAAKPAEALHAYRAIRAMLSWAVQRHYINRSPLENMKPPSKDRHRSRVLSDDELKAIWAACEGDFGTMVRLLILTGARKSEIGTLRWDYIDDGVLTIPAEMTKNGREHRLPLPELAVRILEGVPWQGEYVFPGRIAERPVAMGSWANSSVRSTTGPA